MAPSSHEIIVVDREGAQRIKPASRYDSFARAEEMAMSGSARGGDGPGASGRMRLTLAAG
jgi:hypothetical protein